jgi:hypothetical protein
MRAVCEVRGITLLLLVETLLRCGDGLLFEVPPLASNALPTTLHSLLENVQQTVCLKLQEDSGAGGFDFGAPFSWLEKPINRMKRDPNSMEDVLMGFHRSRWLHPLPLFNRATLTLHKGCSAILKRVGALQEVQRLPREVLRKRDRHRISTKFRLGVIRWVHELCKRPSYEYSMADKKNFGTKSVLLKKKTTRFVFTRWGFIPIAHKMTQAYRLCDVRWNRIRIHWMTGQLSSW